MLSCVCYTAARPMTRSPDRRAPFRTRLDLFITKAARIHHGDIEALHQTRVASRRLRELLPILELHGDAARTLGARLKKVTRRLGVVRELDVLAVMIETLERDQRFPSPALRLVGAAVAESRDAERERLAEKLPVAKLERLGSTRCRGTVVGVGWVGASGPLSGRCIAV